MNLGNEDVFRDFCVERCESAIRDFREKNVVYNAAVKRRVEISQSVHFIWDEDGGRALTAEQHKLLAEYYELLTGEVESDVYLACYEYGLRDCFQLLSRLNLIVEPWQNNEE